MKRETYETEDEKTARATAQLYGVPFSKAFVNNKNRKLFGWKEKSVVAALGFLLVLPLVDMGCSLAYRGIDYLRTLPERAVERYIENFGRLPTPKEAEPRNLW